VAAGLLLCHAPEEGEIEARNSVPADSVVRPANDYVVRWEEWATDATCRNVSGLGGAGGTWPQ